MGQTKRSPADVMRDLGTLRKGQMPTGTKAKPAPPARPVPTTGAQAAALGAAIKKNLPPKKR